MRCLVAPREYFSGAFFQKYDRMQRMYGENDKADNVDINMADIIAAYYSWCEFYLTKPWTVRQAFLPYLHNASSLSRDFELLTRDAHKKWGNDIFLICAEQLKFFSNGTWFVGANKATMALLLLYQLEKAGYFIRPEWGDHITRLVCAVGWHKVFALYPSETRILGLMEDQSDNDFEIQVIARVIKGLTYCKHGQTLRSPTRIVFQKLCRAHSINTTTADDGSMTCSRDIRKKFLRTVPYVLHRKCLVECGKDRVKSVKLDQIYAMMHDLEFNENETKDFLCKIKESQKDRLENLFCICNNFDGSLTGITY